ncbi:hypothetical protein bplSymb_SCF08601P006 [Bathymodiolus platifrons methanotrophic gill symbiont]|uniref:hypothetical protein n=2 Tax=Bathymodiolus platifrons methanotrophic gill symbiont TaxID=113268 RepID=UPI000B419E79|nr:hypothetical protein [Bathymodiolus platifrons methanotrophic gill symbiont]GAW87438.1 hypothetical protein bplSymb_SCF08601P006 [Bathymodiolus platifrons methanotrophic gill symbiont]GFO76390.1 hypothetical protein BPLS_P4135 [Bathymodiolus platifrons methanotrophic gill symbiont]
MSMLSRDLSTLNTINNFGTRAFSYDGNSEESSVHKDFRRATLATTLVIISAVSPSAPTLEETAKIFIKPVASDQVLDVARQDLALLAKIREKSTYSKNWDGNGAQKISKEAINDAETFIRLLLESSTIYSPIISLAADGEINFLWILPNFRFDLGVYGDNTFSYYGKTSDGEEYMADDINVTENLPKYIIDLIEK